MEKPIRISFPDLISQRQIDLEENWLKERITIYSVYKVPFWKLGLKTYRYTQHGYHWTDFQMVIGPMVVEFRIRNKHQ